MTPFDSSYTTFYRSAILRIVVCVSCTVFELIDLEIWVRNHPKSFKLVPFESLGAVSYLPFIVTMALFARYNDLFVENRENFYILSVFSNYKVTCRVHRPLHISWQWYPLVRAFHPRKTQAYWSSFKMSADSPTSAWKRTGLSLQTKIRLYNALVISVLLYGSETWTLLKADKRRLEAFHMNCQRRILGIRWFH